MPAYVPPVSFPSNPTCVIVTGPRGAGKSRYLQALLQAHLFAQPDLRPGILMGETGRTRMESFVAVHPQLALRTLAFPCLCCPEAADLPGVIRALRAEHSADRFYLELPDLAALRLVAEFDRALDWPRRFVVCLNSTWGRAYRTQQLSPFQYDLLAAANEIVDPPASSPATIRSANRITLSLC